MMLFTLATILQRGFYLPGLTSISIHLPWVDDGSGQMAWSPLLSQRSHSPDEQRSSAAGFPPWRPDGWASRTKSFVCSPLLFCVDRAAVRLAEQQRAVVQFNAISLHRQARALYQEVGWDFVSIVTWIQSLLTKKTSLPTEYWKQL